MAEPVREGSTTEAADNTRVARDETVLLNKAVLPVINYTEAIIYDTDKARYYEALQNFYNNNFFGYGVFGNLTHYNPVTLQDEILSNYDYTMDNMYNFATNLLLSGIFGRFQSLIPKNLTGETIEVYEPFKIGEGAESFAFEDTPFRVGKVSTIPVEEMVVRNNTPYTIPTTYRGTVDGVNIYTQPKLRIPQDVTKPMSKLDKLMENLGYTVEGKGTPIHTYVNAAEDIVIDDVDAGNIGIDWLGRPRLIDFTKLSYPEWLLFIGE